ncbi:TonB-dependent receptor [Acidipila sp. EB88]|uniref:TonB-dependent receptor n=1 Tax=Acidipila sp. EB88 TaxID=2305226 RepID=UPI000F5DCA59|nr:carboxypeptidase regulatory-like domain-containing protein [Acidipila sp. EB88]RRA49197.1 TonB-dependent receptor [Acidipila sp. EB88]
MFFSRKRVTFSIPGAGLATASLFVLGAATVSCVPSTAWAQVDQGSISGTVRDPSGAGVPGAKITVINPATGFTITLATDSSGNYTVSPLKLGGYNVKVEAQGFGPTTQENVVVNVASTTTADLTVGVAGSQQNVVVTSAPPALQTEEASTGQVVSAQTINNTPLNGRNFTFIAQLSAGVTPSEQGSRGAQKGDFSANGQRSEQNNFILDGVDNNASLVDFLNGASFVIKPPPDALQEFKVQTGDYTAELGHSAGAVLNVATKSGTNQIHGDLWEYFRNDVLNDRDFFQAAKPKYRQNQFGATLGGPILKDKLFFFGDAEANRIIFGQTQVYTVPTLAERTGDFSDLLDAANNGRGQAITLYQPGGPTRATQSASSPILANNYLAYNGRQNVINPAAINPVAQALLNQEPAPNRGTAANTINNYTFQGNASDNTTQYDGRLDYNRSAKDQLFARYSYSNEPVTLTPPFGILDGGGFGGSGNTVVEGRNFTFSETHVFSPSLVNEFRVGYNWIAAAYIPPNAGTNLSAQFGLGGIPFEEGNGGLPNINFGTSGVSTIGSSQYEPTHEYENVIQILDNVSKQIGNHSIRFGVNIERIRVQTQQPVDPKGTFNFTAKFTQDPLNTSNTGYGAADFLQNYMDTASVANIFTAHNQRFYEGYYFQDNWKATPNLTLNLGLRYEYVEPIKDLNGAQANFVPNYANGTGVYLIPTKSQANFPLTPAFLNGIATNNVSVQYTNNEYLVTPAHLNFSPRIGITYQVNPKTVLRSGFGIFFGGLESVGYSPSLSQNFPFQFDSNFTSGTTCVPGNCATNGLSLQTGFAQALNVGLANFVTLPSPHGYQTDTQTPYSEQFNLTVQRSLSDTTTVTAAYVGALSRHLQVNPDVNMPAGAVPAGQNEQQYRPFPTAFGGGSVVIDKGTSNYNSAQVTVERQLRNGLSFLTAYTWSHSLDDAPILLGGTGGGGYRNWRALGLGFDYGNSLIDTRQRLVLNGQYELPFGHGKKYLNKSGLLNEVAGGWSTALVFRVQTGQPVNIYANNNAGGTGTAEPYLLFNPFHTGGTPTSSNAVCATATHTLATWFNPCAFANPAQATSTGDLASYGPPGRLTVAGPGYNRTDLSIFKSFGIFRETNVQFRTDVFNLWNTPAYGQPGNTTGGGFGQIVSERFGSTGGQYSATAGESPDARVIQFALKYVF